MSSKLLPANLWLDSSFDSSRYAFLISPSWGNVKRTFDCLSGQNFDGRMPFPFLSASGSLGDALTLYLFSRVAVKIELAWKLNKKLSDRTPKGWKVQRIMICVVEYGENIGTLRNLFPDIQQALVFAKQIIALSDEEYTCIGPNQWYCQERKEYVKVEDLAHWNFIRPWNLNDWRTFRVKFSLKVPIYKAAVCWRARCLI